MKNMTKITFAVIFLLSISFVQSIDAPPGVSWWGTVTIDGSSSTYGSNIEAFIDGSLVASDVVGSDATGYYLLNVPCNDGDNVSIRVNGILSSETNTTCDLDNVSTELNLTAISASNGASCTYDDGCSSGYCVDGYCCNSACSGACNVCNAGGSEGACSDVNSLCSGSDSSCYCSGGSCTSCDSGYTCSSYSCSISSSGTSGGYESEMEETKLLSIIKAGETKEIKFKKGDTTGIIKIIIKAKEGINKIMLFKVKVVKKETGKVDVIIQSKKNEQIYSYFDLSVAIPDEDIEEATISFKIPLSWFDNGVYPETISLYRYNNGEWAELETTITGSDDVYYYFEAHSPGFSAFAVKGSTEKIPVDEEEKPVCISGTKKCFGDELKLCNHEETGWDLVNVCDYGCENRGCKITSPESEKTEISPDKHQPKKEEMPYLPALQQIAWMSIVAIMLLILAVVAFLKTKR